MTPAEPEGAAEAEGGNAASDVAIPDRWTVMRLVRWSAGWLAEKGVENARLDVERLLADVLDVTRLDLYLEYDRPLVPDELAAFKERLLRRGAREPLQYVLGRAHFRELELAVDSRALIPRPETEVLVERVLEWAAEHVRDPDDGASAGLDALEVGTGAGAIALSLAFEGPFDRIVATDVSDDALALARANREACTPGAPVDFRRGSVYASLDPDEAFDVVVSNPPYVAIEERESLAPEIREWEPPEAVFAGSDGLDVLRPLVEGAPARVRSGGLLALEVGEEQAEAVARMVGETGAFVGARVHEDLAGRDRIVLAERRG